MASEIDICNLALGHLGDEANVQSIDPPDGTAQAQHCARFYAIARDATLEMHNWGFASRREDLAQLATPTTNAWKYQYQKPVDAVKMICVLPKDIAYLEGQGDDDNKYPFVIEEDRILTNVPDAKARYVARITDPTRFSPLFVVTFSYKLAGFLAGPIIKGTAGMSVAKQMANEAKEQLAHASAADANTGIYKADHVPSWASARGITLTQAKHATRWRR